MIEQNTTKPRPSRTLACAQCGASFACSVDGACWCAAEAYRLPLPTDSASDCLCPACLRAKAQASPLP